MSEGLAQGPYVAARERFEPATFWTQGTELTTEPLHPTLLEDRDIALVCALTELLLCG